MILRYPTASIGALAFPWLPSKSLKVSLARSGSRTCRMPTGATDVLAFRGIVYRTNVEAVKSACLKRNVRAEFSSY